MFMIRSIWSKTVILFLWVLMRQCTHVGPSFSWVWADGCSQGKWLEVLGCGVTEQVILDNNGCRGKKAWAFGLGLERLAMVLFEIPDIRLFWSDDNRFTSQVSINNRSGSLELQPTRDDYSCRLILRLQAAFSARSRCFWIAVWTRDLLIFINLYFGLFIYIFNYDI